MNKLKQNVPLEKILHLLKAGFLAINIWKNIDHACIVISFNVSLFFSFFIIKLLI